MLTVAMLGCTDTIAGLLEEGTEEAVLQVLAGTWNGTKFEFTNKADPAQTFDLIAEGGTLTLTIASDGRYTGQMVMPGETDNISGTLEVQGTNLIMNDDAEPGDPDVMAFTLAATTLTLRFDESFDFDGDGTDEDASVEIVLERG
jgi:hypothetical protein